VALPIKVEYRLLLAKDLDYLAAEEHKVVEAKILDVQHMLPALSQSLKGTVLASSQ
jgi:hypothetical protein